MELSKGETMDRFFDPNPKLMIRRAARRLDQRLLARTINLLHQPALSHLNNAIPPGAVVYRMLYGEALASARTYSEVWSVPLLELHARVPALEHLRTLSGCGEPDDFVADRLSVPAELAGQRFRTFCTGQSRNNNPTHKECLK
jgi:hypothetical protein